MPVENTGIVSLPGDAIDARERFEEYLSGEFTEFQIVKFEPFEGELPEETKDFLSTPENTTVQ